MNIQNVIEFKGFSVNNGQVDVSNDQYKEMINDCYGSVTICGTAYDQGDALEALDPVIFRCGLGDYESEIQSELEEAIDNEDDSDIEWSESRDSEEE